jgi:hypothetical protein
MVEGGSGVSGDRRFRASLVQVVASSCHEPFATSDVRPVLP